MGRWFALFCALALAVGCQGQGGNPFMRTTVPPPATGAGAPSDPYYNNNGAAQSPPGNAPPIVQPPGAAPATPVVPPPDTRYSAPGGYNFPQGSVNHRKAVDPTPNDYRAGTSAIARAARPRNLLDAPGADTSSAIARGAAKRETPVELSQGKVDESSHSDESISDVAGIENSSRTPPSHETAASEVDSDSPVTTMALDSAGENTPEKSVASVRIVSPAEDESKSASPPADMSMTATESTMPPEGARNSASLIVAPPVAADKGAVAATRLSLTAGVNSTKSTSGNSQRFYFDRSLPATRHDAQQANYVVKNGDAVVHASGASATGRSSSPEGAPAYSHHDGYAWVRGKLEYSSAARRWKLRYIPIDGQTDQFGGSMVLPNSPHLEQFHPGDLVTVEGSVGNSPAEHGSFSPVYELRTIKSQR